MSGSHRGPGLGTFVTELRARLEGLSRDDLATVLVAHAERLPASQRVAFLAIFPDLSDHHATRSERRPAGHGLPERVREFAAQVAAGDYEPDDEDYGWQSRFGWEDEEAPPAWVADADALFADASEVFLTGTAEQAREVYDLLLDLFRSGAPGLPDGPYAGDGLELWALDHTDVAETLARYLRCVYETAPAPERAAAVRDAWSGLPWSPHDVTVAAVAGTRAARLPGLAAFLPDWIDQLVDGLDWPRAQDRVRLLAEAADLHHGIDTLTDVARRAGPHQGGISRIRVDALAAAGRLDDAAAAAREALALPELETDLAAGIADRLAELSLTLRDLRGAVDARQVAWHAKATRARLLALMEDARTAQVLDMVLAAEAAQILDSAAAGARPERLACELLLLAGHHDAAIDALTAAEPLGWSRPTHPGSTVLPYLWVAATGVPTRGQLHTLFTAIDDLPDARDYERLFAEADLDDDITEADDRPDHAPRERPALTTLLADLLATERSTADHRIGLLTVARSVADTRIEAIVSNKHRRAYSRAAVLAFAHAEAVATTSTADASAYLSGVRARYPRHVAFRQELDHAARASTLPWKASAR